MIRGIDVSHYQGAVNWPNLAATHRLSFGAAKCSEGLGFVDSQFKGNWAGMKAAGLRRIAYHYASPGSSSARAQAARFVALVDPQSGDGLCLDLEKSNLNMAQSNAWMKAFGDALRDLAPDAVTFAYLGGYSKNGTGRDAVEHFDRWWYPRYASMDRMTSWETDFTPRLDANTTGWPRPHIWQWTPNLNGMDANVSPLTVDHLFTKEDNMPTADEVAKATVDELLARRLTNPLDPTGATTARLDTMLEQTYAQARTAALNTAGGPAAIADAVLAKLPPAVTGGISKDDVRAAVVDVLTNGTNGGTA
jgi:hypothetical protein